MIDKLGRQISGAAVVGSVWLVHPATAYPPVHQQTRPLRAAGPRPRPFGGGSEKHSNETEKRQTWYNSDRLAESSDNVLNTREW